MGELDFQSYHNIQNVQLLNKKIIKLTKKWENIAHSWEKKNLTETIPEEA